jgi:hypothetical protein
MSNIKKLRTGLGLDPQSADPSNPVQGQIQYADGTVRPKGLWIYDGSAWVQAGGGAGGGLDVFYTNDYETTASSGFTTGKDATFDNGGTLGGALSDETSSPLSGDTSVKYVTNASAGSSDNDWIASESISLDPKQIGNYVGASFVYTWDGSDDLIEFVIWDDTNNVKLSDSLDVLKTASNSTRFSVAAFIPASCSAIKIGFQHTGASESSKTLIFDDVQLSTDPFTYANLENFSNPAPFTPTLSASFGTTTTEEAYYWQEGKFLNVYGSFVCGTVTGSPVSIDLPSGFTIDDTYIATTNENIVVGEARRIVTSATLAASNHALFYDGSDTGTLFISRAGSSTTALEKTGGSTMFNSGETVTFHYKVPVVEYSPTSEHVVTPARSSKTVEKILSADVTSAGDIADLTFSNLEVGNTYIITGKLAFVANASTVRAYSESNASGELYGVLTRAGDNEDYREIRSTSLIITAKSANLYINFDGGGTCIGDGTKEETFLQLTNITSQFLTAIPVQKTAYLKDVKTSGTAGGASTANTVHTRELNTVEGDSEIISLSSNQFTLQPGKYELDARAPGYVTNRQQLFIYNVTDSAYAIDGESEFAGAASVQQRARLVGTLELSSPKTFELRHWIESANASGLGLAADNNPSNPQTAEIYSVVKITKIK